MSLFPESILPQEYLIGKAVLKSIYNFFFNFSRITVHSAYMDFVYTIDTSDGYSLLQVLVHVLIGRKYMNACQLLQVSGHSECAPVGYGCNNQMIHFVYTGNQRKLLGNYIFEITHANLISTVTDTPGRKTFFVSQTEELINRSSVFTNADSTHIA